MDLQGHAIRLRGGWEWHDPDAPGQPPKRLALPTAWPANSGSFARLVRRFNRPPIDADERVILSMERVDGLVSASLNEAEVVSGAEIQQILHATNRLILDVELSDCAGVASWGEVALVIVPAKQIGEGRAVPLS
jgi:hypothetical protein